MPATPFAEMHADVAVDGSDRVWVAWEEGGLNWGKDTGYENPQHRIFLRPGGSQIYGPPNSQKALYRRPRLAALVNGQWLQPKAHLEDAYPATMQKNLYMSPRLGLDGNGRMWLFLRHQLIAQGRNGGQMFDYYATTLLGGAPSNAGCLRCCCRAVRGGRINGARDGANGERDRDRGGRRRTSVSGTTAGQQ